MRIKILLTIGGLAALISGVSLNCLSSPAYAARKRVRKTTNQVQYVPQGVKTQIRFRSDGRGLLINFSSFDRLASGRYELIYEADGVTQGAGGTIILGDTGTKEVLFGTCSGGICHWHKNISNARLSIYSTLKDGTTILKPYRIKL